jgi:hypothetical protein
MKSDTVPAMDGILQLGFAFWGSKTLLSAVELGVFTHLAQGPADLESLRSALGLHQRGARDFFDTLVALNIIERRDGRYVNSPAADYYLDRRKPSYVGGILEMANKRLYPFWSHLTEALKTGSPQNESKHGKPDPFKALYADPDNLRVFLRAMTGISRGANIAISEKFPFGKYEKAVDVGTAQGDLIAQVALKHTHIIGTGYDLPAVQPIFNDYIVEQKLEGRVAFQPGNFFEEPLPAADVIMMGHILHDWDLDQKKMLIKKAYDALSPDGALIVYDSIIDDDRSKNAFGLLMSLNMLIETPGGFDYTAADCITWMKEIGFRSANVEHLVGPDSMVVGFK